MAHLPEMTKMAAAKSSSATRSRAREVTSSGTGVRDRVRDLSAGALRGKFSLGNVRKVVQDVLDGAVEGVDKSIPQSRDNVLREVFDGLSEGVRAIASAGSGAVREVRERGAAAGKNAAAAGKRVQAANEEFLGAVRTFAGKTSAQVREELDSLVARARRTGPAVAGSARKAVTAADGRLLELSRETAGASVRVVRRAAGALAMGAGGLLQGLAGVVTPREPAARKKAARPGGKKPGKKRAKAAGKKAGKKGKRSRA